MKVILRLVVGNRGFSRKIKLPECPSPGDEITVWPKKKKKGGLVVTVNRRSWDNKIKFWGSSLVFVCTTKAPNVTEEYLEERNWK